MVACAHEAAAVLPDRESLTTDDFSAGRAAAPFRTRPGARPAAPRRRDAGRGRTPHRPAGIRP
jgi:hypothetical protein